MDIASVTCIILAAAAAGFTQGFTGFGSTVVALPLMVLVLDPRCAVPAGCLMALSINVFMVAGLRAHIQRSWLLRLLLASLPGMAAGYWLLGAAPQALLKGLLGISVLSLIFLPQRHAQAAPAAKAGWMLGAGLAAGCLGVSIGVNGPPIVALAARQNWPRQTLKATLTSYFLITGIVTVALQATAGLLTPQALWLYAMSFPALLLGLWAGTRGSARIGDAGFRRAVLFMLALTGAALTWQAAREWP